MERAINRTKSKVRAKVERAIGVINQAHLRLREGALPWAGKERQPAVRYLRTGQSVPGARQAVATTGVVRPQDAKGRQKSKEKGNTERCAAVCVAISVH